MTRRTPPWELASYFSGHSTFSRASAEVLAALTGTPYAADQAGISRLYGGIHPRVDDFTGRIVGSQVGIGAWQLATRYFDGTAVP